MHFKTLHSHKVLYAVGFGHEFFRVLTQYELEFFVVLKALDFVYVVT